MNWGTGWKASCIDRILRPALVLGWAWTHPQVPEWAVIVGFSLIYGGAQYLLLAGAVLVLLWHRPAGSWRRTAVIAPVLMVPAFWIGFSLYVLWDGLFPLSSLLGFQFIYFTSITLVLGYAYVGLAFALYAVLRRIRLLAPA